MSASMEGTMDMETSSNQADVEGPVDGKETCENGEISNLENMSEGGVEKAMSDNSTTHMSKTQLKKLMRKQKWLDSLKDKRKQEKEKRKRKMAEAREKGISLGPTRKSLKENSMKNSACKTKVVIDCYFDKYMNGKDINKMVQQLQFCYSINRRATSPLQFYVCCSNEKTKERLDQLADYKNWDMYFHENHYSDVFPKEEIIYLTSESPNVLTELEPDKAYIVGGLVDHNHEKGLCYELAEKRGINHAKLPIGDFIQMKSRTVLAINHVFEILLRYTETKDWLTAFLQVIPQRKTKGKKKKPGKKDCEDNLEEQVENPDNACEEVEKQNIACGQLEKSENTCKQVVKHDSSGGGVEKQDSSGGGVEKQDSSGGGVEKQDSSGGGVEKQDSSVGFLNIYLEENSEKQQNKGDNSEQQSTKGDNPETKQTRGDNHKEEQDGRTENACATLTDH